MADPGAVARFRGDFLAFWRGPYKALPLHTTSIIAPQKGGRPYSQLTTKELNRLEAVSALGFVMAHNFRAYAVAWAYDFEGRSRHPEKWAKRFGISERSLHRLVEEFWTLLYEHCYGIAPGETKEA